MADTTSVLSSFAVRGAYATTKTLDKIAPLKPPGNGFDDMVAKAASDALKTVREGDSMARAGLEGRVGMQEVIEATMAMESTVKVSVALRDKLVEAYHEILKMPI